MKTNPALDSIVGASHRVIVEAHLTDADGTALGRLPVAGGYITASGRFGPRWAATLDVAGADWIPHTPTDPLSGFADTTVTLTCGAVVDQTDQTVDVCRLLVNGATATRTRGDWQVTVDLVDVLAYIAQGASSSWLPLLDETCQAMIRRIIEASWPPQWTTGPTFVDTTTGVAVPLGATWEDSNPADVIWDLCQIANITVYADHDQTIVLRPPLPTTPGTPARAVSATSDMTRYEVRWGRDEFANAVRLAFQPVGGSGRTALRARWTYTRQTGAPTQGQMRVVDAGGGLWQVRVHYRDNEGFRRVRGLDRAAQGDLMTLTDADDGEAVLEIREATDEGTYYSFVTRILAGSMNLSQGTPVELRAYIAERDPIIGYAEQTTGTLAVSQVGRVLLEQTIQGEVTQARANARAAALLAVQVRGYAGHVVDAIPDYRLEPDDDITVTFPDGTTATSRITELELPLTVGDPMRLAVRPFTDQGAF